MAYVYYLNAIETNPDRHKILALVSDAAFPTFDPSGLNPDHSRFFIAEIAENRQDLTDLEANLARVRLPGQPPVIYWQYVDGGRLRRADGSLWTPAVNADLDNLLNNAQATHTRLLAISTTYAGMTTAQRNAAVQDLALNLDRL